MATETIVADEGTIRVVSLSRTEIVGIVSLLTAQLAGLPVSGNHAGGAPTVNVVDRGVILYRLALCLEGT
jgi:hypothetical protein